MNWKKIVGTVAPTLATALGGPLAGVAVRTIAGAVLGKDDASEQEVETAILGASPDTLIKLRQLDQDFKTKMLDAGIELERLDVEDRKDARSRQVLMKDWVPSALALIVALVFFALLFMMLSRTLPPENKDAFNILLGGLGGSLTTVMTYYFGSSRGSSYKDETISKALGAK